LCTTGLCHLLAALLLLVLVVKCPVTVLIKCRIAAAVAQQAVIFSNEIARNDLFVNFNERNGSLEDKYKLTPVKCAGAVVASTDTTILMHDTGMISWICGERKTSEELKVTKVMLTLFQKYDKGGLMLDIGANAGYYSLLAAKMGHNSVQFDLQPECQNICRNSVLANKFQNQIITIAAGVSDSDGTVEVPVLGCNGQFPQILPKKGTPQQVHSCILWVILFPMKAISC